MAFAIEIKTEHHGWSDDPALLGIGCTETEIDGHKISVEAGLNAIDAADDLGLYS